MLTPSLFDRQYETLFAPLLGSTAHLRPVTGVLPSACFKVLLVIGLNGPAFDAKGLSFCVVPTKTVFRASAQKPVITDDLLKSPLVTKLTPAFWTSVTALSFTRDQNGRIQTAARFFSAQLN